MVLLVGVQLNQERALFYDWLVIFLEISGRGLLKSILDLQVSPKNSTIWIKRLVILFTRGDTNILTCLAIGDLILSTHRNLSRKSSLVIDTFGFPPTLNVSSLAVFWGRRRETAIKMVSSIAHSK